MSQEALREGLSELIQREGKGYTTTKCSIWSARHRVMGNPFPGQYGFEHHPWAREVHDSLAAYTIAMKAAQTGITEVGINRAFYTLDKLKRDVLYVLPTTLAAGDFSTARFTGALSLSPHLTTLFAGGTNKVQLKSTGINTLYIRGSRGKTNLKSIPVSELILDEMDEMSQEAIGLALERLSGQLEKHILAISTPTVPQWGIHKFYLDSTQEHFTFKCPHCGRHTELIWPDCIQMCGESVSDPRCHESYLQCKECHGKLIHEAKTEWLKNGVWQVTNHQVSPKESRGFNINQLYSSTVSPGEIVIQYHRGLGDEAAAQELHNSKLGLPFVGAGAQVTDEMINNAIGDFTTNSLQPRDRSGLRTLGVDQGKTCYASVVEWQLGRGSEFDIQASAFGKLIFFTQFKEDEWYTLDEMMRDWQIHAAVIDLDPQVNEVREFCRRYQGCAWGSRYRRGQTAKELTISDEETGAPLATVDRTAWLSASLGKLKCNPPRLLLPQDLSQEYRDHLKALCRSYKKDNMGNSVSEYLTVGGMDHFAHSLCYANIGLSLLMESGAFGANENIRGVV